MSLYDNYDGKYTDGKECSVRRAYIFLYPNTQRVENYWIDKGDDIPTAIDGAFSQLLNDGAITYYELKRADMSSMDYPDLDFTDTDDLRNKFDPYLKKGYKNGTGRNLKDHIGIHMLVHYGGCNLNTAGGEHADDCGDPSAFERGVMAFTGSACSAFSGLRKNSAIQEPVHGFINYDKAVKGTSLVPDGDGPYDEHRLGEVIDGEVTPMLTYHHNESSLYGEGKCDGDGTTKDGYRQRLTPCTEDAVERTAKNLCNGQQPLPDSCSHT